MPKMKYNKTFRDGIIALLFCLVLFGGVLGLSIVSGAQYDALTETMLTTDATITDIHTKYRRRSGRSQELYITYVVKEATYERQLSTDTPISFGSSFSTNFDVGDVITIYYNPDHPTQIATPLSLHQIRFWHIFSGIFFPLCMALLVYLLRHRKRFLITEEAYNAEKEKRRAKNRMYDGCEGTKIRVQYLNGFLFFMFCICLMATIMIAINTVRNGEGTKLTSFGDVAMVFFVAAVLLSPVWILSLCNRRWFGKVVCVVGKEGILYGKKRLPWERIERLEYTFSPSPGGCHVRVIGDETDIRISGAPFLLLTKTRKYNKDVKLRLSTPSAILFAAVLLLLLLLALYCMTL